jgi:hypothetical protein
MKTEKSIDLIVKLERKTEEHLSLAVHTFQNLSDVVLLRPSVHGGWSIAQCLDHLNRYGNFYLPHIKSAMEKQQHPAAREVFKSGWFGNHFINMMDPKTGKRYKALKEFMPSQELRAHEIVAEFIHQQEMVLNYLDKAVKTDLSTGKVPVSFIPLLKLKLGDAFRFLIIHNERHVLQAKRNLEP